MKLLLRVDNRADRVIRCAVEPRGREAIVQPSNYTEILMDVDLTLLKSNGRVPCIAEVHVARDGIAVWASEGCDVMFAEQAIDGSEGWE